MKIIDKTSLQDANGNVNIINRLQGTLKYGFSWYPELEAQKKVIPVLDRFLDKGYLLIRNYTLPNSDIVIPLILIGPSAVSIIVVSPVNGHFEAKGMEWNTISSNGAPIPAKRNLIELASKLTRAFQKYLDRFKISVPVPVEPVLLVSDPGAQVDATRPAVRVVRSDAIKQFANSLMQARPILRTDSIFSLGDRIVDPTAHPEVQLDLSASEDNNPSSRAQAIFNAAETSQSFNPNDLGFEFNDEEGNQAPAIPADRPAPPAAAQKRKSGMSRTQVMLLVGMAIIECCVLAAGGAILYFFSP